MTKPGVKNKLIARLTSIALFASTGFLIAQTPAASAEASLERSIQTYLRYQPGDYSVTAIELGGQAREVHMNDRLQVDPASIFKLYYALFALEKIQTGVWSTGTRLGSNYLVTTCLKMMLSYSDNECASDFRKKLGSKYVNGRLAKLGFTDSRIILDSRGNYGGKRTSTRDVAKLLTSLEKGQLLNAANTTRFRNYLKAQIWRARISSALQAGTPVASKSGQLLTKWGMIEADSAIVYGPTSTYVLVVIGIHNATGSVVRGISDLVYRHWQGAITRASNYPSAQLVTSVKANFRSYPNGRIIRVVPAGTSVTVQWTTRGWVYLKIGSTKGYLYHDTLKLSARYLRWGTP